MSLAIDIDAVTGVLLADGWHTVDPLPDEPDVSSFALDAFELGTHVPGYDGTGQVGWRDFDLIHGAGIGFAFREHGVIVAGPFASILGLSYPASGRYEAADAETIGRQRVKARSSSSSDVTVQKHELV
jgi:hypothetical protein